MRRTALQRKTPLRSRAKLRQQSKSTPAKKKRDIQALLRECAILRDGGCALRNHPDAGRCGGYRADGQLVLQAEHLNSRRHSATYAELDNIVCLCQYHHIFFKKQEPALYWDIVRDRIGPDRWAKLQGWARLRHVPFKPNWDAAVAKLAAERDRLASRS